MTLKRKRWSLSNYVLCTTFSVLCACSDDADSTTSNDDDKSAATAGKGGSSSDEKSSGGSGGSSATDQKADDEKSAATDDSDALYLVTALPVAGDDASHGDEARTYLNLVKKIDGTTKVDPSGGLEVPGVPFVHEGSVYVADAEAPTLTKYTLSKDDKLEQGDKLSFASAGVNTPLESIYIVSKTKGYFFDDTGLRIIVWNPSDMSLTGDKVDISKMEVDGHTAYTYSAEHNVRRDGDVIFVPVVWFDQDDNLRRNNGVLVIDTNKDEVLDLLDDDRCGGGGAAITSAEGDFYFFPSAGNSLNFTTQGEPAKPSCALRVKKGQRKFDPDYTLPLSDKVDGAGAQGAFPAPNGFLFTSVDKKAFESREADYGPFWAFKHYDWKSGEVKDVEGMPFWSGSSYYFQFDGRTIVPLFEGALGDGSNWKSTYYEVSKDAEPKELFAIEARWGALARLR